WEHRYTSHGRLYYVDHNTASLPVNDHQDTPLLDGWECRYTSSGQTYYVDHNTCSTTWDRP
ncbi:hypothetical protein B0H14DRAFT_2212049, partial [Mycena olivaceomarginata]